MNEKVYWDKVQRFRHNFTGEFTRKMKKTLYLIVEIIFLRFFD